MLESGYHAYAGSNAKRDVIVTPMWRLRPIALVRSSEMVHSHLLHSAYAKTILTGNSCRGTSCTSRIKVQEDRSPSLSMCRFHTLRIAHTSSTSEPIEPSHGVQTYVWVSNVDCCRYTSKWRNCSLVWTVESVLLRFFYNRR
jgi:hypothetical protein